jgi:hypothetical protein
MDNIAEGFEREGNKEFVNFLYIAKGSCGEVRSQIIRASDVGFIDKDTATRLYNDCMGLSKAISKFIKTLKDSGFAGSKFFAEQSGRAERKQASCVPLVASGEAERTLLSLLRIFCSISQSLLLKTICNG